MKIVGRKTELSYLKQKIESKKAEFIAVTGRRRIGKTFLIRQFADTGTFFEVMGEKDAGLQLQLASFYQKLKPLLKSDLPIKEPTSWREAFALLTAFINVQNKNKPLIIFIDELPWLATPKSGLIQALDYYWNSEWSKINHLTLIVCGSASSWVREKLINAKGGLYNRITGTIHLQPLNLREAKLYMKAKGLSFNDQNMIEAYMVVGGVPFYLDQLLKSKSLAQNISSLCFSETGLLFSEYDRLFKSLFGEDSIYENLVAAIASKRYGISRSELIKLLKIKSGGYLSKYLNDLEASGFIQIFTPFQNKKKDYLIRVTDEYTLFYLHWIKPFAIEPLNIKNTNYWQNSYQKPTYNSWVGLAFEALCLKHSDEIIKALALEGLVKNISFNWFAKGNKMINGAQADLIFDRTDGVINLCEIKFSNNPFLVDKEMAKNLLNKLEVFKKNVALKKEIHLTLITANGLKTNPWSEELLNSHIDIPSIMN
jgi:AAA+ ATPase superfamily predicted ATPase